MEVTELVEYFEVWNLYWDRIMLHLSISCFFCHTSGGSPFPRCRYLVRCQLLEALVFEFNLYIGRKLRV